MNSLMYVLVLLTLVGLALLGCADNSNPLLTSKDNSIAINSGGDIVKMGDELHSATGSAHWRFVNSQTQVRCSFSAIQHLDGSITGQVMNNDRGPTLKLHGEVYDLMVEENRAKICFTVTSGEYTGVLACMVVVDNSENNEADIVSTMSGALPGTYFPEISMTIEQLNALGIDEYLNNVLILWGMTYEEYMLPMDQGSVHVF